MKFAAEQPAAERGVTRRALLGGGLALTLAGCNSGGLEMPSDAGGARRLRPLRRQARRWSARRWAPARFGSA